MTKRAFIAVLSMVFLLYVPWQSSGRLYAASVSDTALSLTTFQAITREVKSLLVEPSGAKSPKTESIGAKSSNSGKSKGKTVSESKDNSTPGEKVSKVAFSLVGTPYRWGGETVKGFDCSGFTRYVYRHSVGIQLPRTSSRQAKAGKHVKKNELVPGDIVYFKASRSGVGHVGIFVGSGQFVHATVTNGVKVSYLSEKHWVKRYLGAVRIIS